MKQYLLRECIFYILFINQDMDQFENMNLKQIITIHSIRMLLILKS